MVLHTVAIISLVAGCVTTPEQSAPAPSVQPATTGSQAPDTARSGPLPPAERLMRDLAPRGGRAVFLGIAPRLRDREDEETAALLHAAEQASRYERMSAEYSYVGQRGSSQIGYVEDISATWSGERADQLLETMEVLATERDNEGTYVLATTAAIPPAPRLAPLGDQGGEPAWVRSPPRIPGHLVAVGVADRSRRVRDSVDRADQDALRELLLQSGATLRIVQDTRDVEGVGTADRVTAAQAAEAAFVGFYVLARYATGDGRFYYSLAIAREE